MSSPPYTPLKKRKGMVRPTASSLEREASNVTSAQTNKVAQSSFLEPTPIATTGIRIVDRVKWHETRWDHDEAFEACLALLRQTPGDDPRRLSFSEFPSNLTVADACQARRPAHTMDDSASLSAPSPTQNKSKESGSAVEKFKQTQQGLWDQRYQELAEFHREYGHVNVPVVWPTNPSLSHWIKRQRSQYHRKQEGKHSALNDDRQMALEKLGFVWDSHKASWDERFTELLAYREIHGNCNVPSTFPENVQLSIWVKGQRRQFKLFTDGKKSNITRERISKLSNIGFEWTPRHKQPASANHTPSSETTASESASINEESNASI